MPSDIEYKMDESVFHKVRIVTNKNGTINGEVEYFESRFEVAEDEDEEIEDVQAFILCKNEKGDSICLKEDNIKSIEILD